MIAAIRVALAAVVLVSAVLVVLPGLADPSRRATLGDYGICGLVILFLVIPWWLGPFAIYQTAALRVEGDRLTAYTLWDRREFDLGSVRRLWIRKLDGERGEAVWAGLSGPSIPSLWVSWSVPGRNTSARVGALVADVARRPHVQVSTRARAALGLPGGPTVATRTGLWLRGFLVFCAYCALMTAALVGYIDWIVDTSPL